MALTELTNNERDELDALRVEVEELRVELRAIKAQPRPLAEVVTDAGVPGGDHPPAIVAQHERSRGIEAQHRLRNLLTVIRSVFARTIDAGGDLDEVSDHFRGRLDSLARTEVAVTQTRDGRVDLENMIRDELLSVGVADGPRLTIEGPEVSLPADTASALGLALHELVTNSIKFGALRHDAATLDISWTDNINCRGERQLHFKWTEQGVPLISLVPNRSGFGRELIEEALPYRLGAETSLAMQSGGVCCAICLPLPGSGAGDVPS